MKTDNILLILLSIIIFYSCDIEKSSKSYKNQLSGINPITYTDVVYIAEKDSVITSTFTGRVSIRVKEDSEERLITEIDDEIYALEFSKNRNEIIASTNSKGVLVIDLNTGKIKNTLKIKDKSWTLNTFFSDDESELYAFDLKGNNYVWDAENNYQLIDLPENFPENYLRTIKNNHLFSSGRNQKISIWNKKDSILIKENKLKGTIVDVDNNDNLLLLDDNTFIKYSAKKDTILYSKTHPSWIRFSAKGDTIRDTYTHLKLTTAIFIEDKILTAGADQSIRVWDSKTGELLDDLIGHKASITSIDISRDKLQFVSVDAKGGIKFWNLNNN